MNCDEARLLIGAEPTASPPALEEHLRDCPDCSHLREEMRTLEANIQRALERPPDVVRRQVRPSNWRQWALAAGAVLATFAVLAVWLLRPSATLAQEIVAHVQGEPDSWFATQRVSAQSIDKTLQRSGVRLDISSDRIMYARSCWFRGHYVPHLVLQTARGPVTVMILRHVGVEVPRRFREAGMTGVIVPAEAQGSIAVLARGATSVDDVATQMRQEVHWLPDEPQS
jgi:Protein of unknown function (DUF3379)